jgi:radical SAM protein with 4Fe4S-binding SPASM domain
MKYYKISSQVLFRNYGEFGYLTDNRNFGYNFSNMDFVLGDEIVSETGADILSCLEKTPLSIDEITSRVTQIFDADINLQNDIVEFLDLLSSKGFIMKGESFEECSNCSDVCITGIDRSKKQNSHKKANAPIETQTFLVKYFGDKPFPTSIHVEIVSECNERCIHCYIPHELKTDLMDSNLFYRVLDQSREMNLLHITISGGEPMLHPRLVDFLKRCREYDLSVNVLTNLTLLSENIINEMIKNPLLSIQTSIYSMIPEIHDAITRHNGSLYKTVNSVLKLIENHIPVQINCPIMNVNYNSYKGVLEWASTHNIPADADYSIIAKFNHHKDNLNCRLSNVQLEQIIAEKINNISSYNEIKKEIADNKLKSSDDSICSICKSSICIGPTGDVYPCVGWSNKIVGNIQDHTLQDIWLKSKNVKSLQLIKRKNFIECESCEQKYFCTICMARNSNESPSGDLFETSKYFCNIAKIKKLLYEKKS